MRLEVRFGTSDVVWLRAARPTRWPASLFGAELRYVTAGEELRCARCAADAEDPPVRALAFYSSAPGCCGPSGSPS